ncbi:MAG: AbrB/MazE/SpoVT family DNA-binding domain-containing protein [Clostridia bacterium]|nr:AbrB/MazE/SpoVT family DNA-binding domain-containing protein [Clostridia bacterium]
MKSTGMIRSVDKMGRVVIPKEIRAQLGVENDVDSFEIYMEGDNVVLRKYQPTCIFCNNIADSVELSGHTVCKDCIEKLNELKKDSEESYE